METQKDSVAAMYAPFGEYVPGVAKLMIWHIWDLARRSGASTDEQMEKVAWLVRLATIDRRALTDIASLPEWQKTRNRVVEVMDACNSERQTPVMEQQCLDMLLPWFRQRFRPDYVFPKQTFHHLWYTMHEDNKLVAVHRAIENACDKHPSIREVECGTWMNNVPRFLQFWPESYHNNRQNWEDTGGFGPGWWGQYLKATGEFNEKAAEILRSTGKHRNPISIGRCPVKDVLTHLRKFLS
jgi:hypothetical protein